MSTTAEDAARWLAEAWETGNPLAALPDDIAPRDAGEGEAVAGALADQLGQRVIGLRLAPGPSGAWLAGPVLEPRMLRAGTPVSLAAYRHAALSAGVLGVLAEDLGESGDPVFASLHPVLDLAAERWTEPARDDAARLADLNGLGVLLVGKRTAAPGLPETSDARLGRTGERPRPERTPLAALMARAVEAARGWGGLPKGAVVAVVGLGGAHAPAAGEKWSAAVPPVGRIGAAFD